MPNAGRTFDPTFPVQIQRQDWTCSIRTTMMLLDSIGIEVSPDEAQDAMSPRYVTPARGLLDARGNGIVEVLRDRWNVEAFNDDAATFDEVAAKAGQQPVALGLRNWGGPGLGHWAAVRGFDGSRLILANPGGTGPLFGQQALTREQFDARGPASMVVVPLEASAPASALRGIDVASWQGAPDWDAVAASGIAFAFTKVTEDDDYQNPTFARNWSEIKRVGLVRGAYHYAQPEGNDAHVEADYFVGRIESVGGVQAGDLLALDLEAGSGNLAQWTLDFLKRVEALTGTRPFVYTGAWFSTPHGIPSRPEIARYPLWLAAYTGTMPPAPPPWTEVTIWQHSASGHVPGIVGDVDLNEFRGTREQLLALGTPGANVEPTPADPRDEQIRALTARVSQLEAEKAGLVSTLGYLTGDVERALRAAVDELKRHGTAA